MKFYEIQSLAYVLPITITAWMDWVNICVHGMRPINMMLGSKRLRDLVESSL